MSIPNNLHETLVDIVNTITNEIRDTPKYKKPKQDVCVICRVEVNADNLYIDEFNNKYWDYCYECGEEEHNNEYDKLDVKIL